ncbi:MULTISPECIES: ADP-ribosyltransferase [Aeromonas]|uniref:ADP-ribosyltransferase n=1 Tax=Aeromonas TaxID=642 RepID=UPI0002F4194F|nr:MULTISPECIES: ADP-ribosyltransferase [Aeromonas]MCF5852508.1 hypothetical protein [Aeromonas veronii]
MHDVLGSFDFDQIMDALSGKTINLNKQQKEYAAAIYHYTEDGYDDVNSYLRGINSGDTKINKTIDYIDLALKWLGDYDTQKPVVRYSNLAESDIEKIKKQKTAIHIPSYTSTSANPNFTSYSQRDFKFIIYRKKGSFIGDFSAYPYEEEVLIPRDALFKVLKFDESENIVYLKQIDVDDLRLAVNNNNEVTNEI